MVLKRRFSSFRESQRKEMSRIKNEFSSFRQLKNQDSSWLDFKTVSQDKNQSQWIQKHKNGREKLTLTYDNGEEITLKYRENESIRFKDFTSEVRASLDIEALLDDSLVMLDVSENSLEDILSSVLNEMLKDTPHLMDEALDSLFMADDRTSLARVIQANIGFDETILGEDQTWFVTMATLTNLSSRLVGLVRLNHPHNLGPGIEEAKYIVVVLCPSKIKETKNAIETGRTFATLLADVNLRNQLRQATSEQQFRNAISSYTRNIGNLQTQIPDEKAKMRDEFPWYYLGFGIMADIRRRLPHYPSDYLDGIFGEKALQKTTSTTLYLYFACLLPIIALGELDSTNTHGKIGVMSAIVGQTIDLQFLKTTYFNPKRVEDYQIDDDKNLFFFCFHERDNISYGGILFALFSGQPLVVIMTTAPIALYIKIVENISRDHGMDFYATYTCVGLWNTFYLTIYSLTNMAKVMKYMTRSTEEIFSLFICVAFTVDSTKDTVKHFYHHYLSEDCKQLDALLSNTTNITEEIQSGEKILDCQRDSSLLFLLLMLGTVWLGLLLHRFTSTPYLQARKREIIADYALPVAVIVFSFIGSYLFSDVRLKQFHTKTIEEAFVIPDWGNFTGKEVLAGFLLAFPLSLLFFLDQNIAASMVNNPDNKLKKGPAYNWDMMLIGLLNIILSIFGLPWMHAVLPHSPLHVRALADIEEHVHEGHVYDIITNVRETRLSNLISNILIGLSILLIPRPLNYIPKPVLDGLFLYLAATALEGNQMFERFLLFFTEQTAYPPNHYIRRVPQKKIHIFTICQIIQLAVLCILGFYPWPYIKVIFPVILSLFMPIRKLIMPRILENKYLQVLDAEHNS